MANTQRPKLKRMRTTRFIASSFALVVACKGADDKAPPPKREAALGLVENCLRNSEQPRTPQIQELSRANATQLQQLLADLPANEMTRISVARHRGEFSLAERDFADLIELGGFNTSGG